ncbi:MAG TPA: tRNA pseudouridine(55) synthase TruB [Acidobacteriota bacterium]|nr:tRNA pseudouridine(55) synthase TruB [Acidobacteriota bacterium]
MAGLAELGNDHVGMLVADKPAGVTSHDVVAKVRHRLQCRAGHTGTLDPQATGVLLLCLGRATRLARFLQSQDKLYECGVRFGWATDTYDSEGEMVGSRLPVPAIEPQRLAALLDAFVGEIQQVPPAYSAKKIRGQPAYKRVRRGEVVVHEPVPVQVYSIDLIDRDADVLRLRVHCGSGTYVRTLAHDIGAAMGCAAHLAALRRLRVGRFDLSGALSWEALESGPVEDIEARILPAAAMVQDWPGVVVDRAGIDVLRNGGVLEPHCIVDRLPAEAAPAPRRREGWVRVMDPDARLLAAAELLPGGMLQPRIVLLH